MAEKIKFQAASAVQLSFLQCKSDFIIYGGGAGSGKTHLALMYCLQFIHDPNFRGVFIRQTTTQLTQAGGLWQEAMEMYCKHFGATAKAHPNMVITFPSGAQIQFKVSSGPRDTKNFDGGQYSLVVFDEAQWHTREEISYLESRIRSKAKGPHRLVCTCNPLRTSFLYEFVKPYLDLTTGIPLASESGKQRWYAQYEGRYVFGESKEEMFENYGPSIKPQTYTFIAANIYSNPVIIKRNPGYLSRLENLKRVERERLLLGSWHAMEENAGYFKRDWVEIVEAPPHPTEVVGYVRSWDFAATLATEANPNPDYTACVRISKDKFGIYYIEDVFRFRKLADGVLKEVIKTAKADGPEVQLTIPLDGGAGGKTANLFFIRTLAENGIAAKSVKISGHVGKVQRFLPFASVAEAGGVRVVRGDWNEEFFNELESFDGKSRTLHDDMVDACADAFNTLSKQQVIPTFAMPDMSKPSIISQMK